MFRNLILPQATLSMPPRVPAPSHRHAAPSGPWPFVDIDDEVDPNRIEDPNSHIPMSAEACEHKQTKDQEVCWCKYPQALYPNWTQRQQKKSRIARVIARRLGNCKMRYLDVREDGIFVSVPEREVNQSTQDTQWNAIQTGRPDGVRIRMLFVDDLTGPVLQMLGTRYNIEPFFFSSAIGWIPSRFQTNVVPGESDHITITLTYLRSIINPTTAPPSPNASDDSLNFRMLPDLVIDTQSPLPLRSSGHLLLTDQLALHMVRSRTTNTIISLHPGPEQRATTAETLHSRVHLTGKSVYWSNISKDTTDPTFIFLSFLWYALYAWDEAQERLYSHICYLESQVIVSQDMGMTQELHVVRAHLLHYESLLHDFKKTVMFVLETPNPSLQSEDTNELRVAKKLSETMMKRECGTLLLEIDRLERSRDMQDRRLKNVMDMSFSIVNIEDSRRMKKLTEAAVRDSAAMKQVAYLTMVFLPSTFVAAVFGMNITALQDGVKGTLSQYIGIAVALTALTIWVIVAFQIQMTAPVPIPPRADAPAQPQDVAVDTSPAHPVEAELQAYSRTGRTEILKQLTVWDRLWWPVVLFSSIVERRKRRKEDARLRLRR